MSEQPFKVISNAEVWKKVEDLDEQVHEVRSDVGVLKSASADHEIRIRAAEMRKRFEAKDWLILIAVIGGTAASAAARAVGIS